MSTDPSGSGTTTPFYHHDQHTQPSYPTDQQNYHHNAQPNYQQQSQSPESSYTVTSAAQVRIDYQEQRAPGESPGATARGTSPSTSSEMKQCTVRGCSQMVPIASPNKMCETCRGRHRIYASTKRARRKMEKAVVAARNAEALGLPVPAGITLTTQPGLSQQVNAETQLGWMPQVTPSTIVEGSTDISSQPSASTRTMNAWETAIDPSLTSQTWDDSPVINAASGSTIYPPLQGRQMQLSQPHSSSSELANALTLPTPQSQSQSGTMYEQDKAITVSAETLSPAASTSTNINPYSKYFRTGGHAAQEHDWHLSNSSGVQSTSESSSQSKSSKISCDQSDIQIPSKLSTTQLNLGLPREEEEESNMQSENEDQNYRNHDEIATSDQEVVAAIPPTNVSTSNSTTSVEAQNVIDNENPESPPKYCSVKGCKKVMPGSYGFRMCPECRTRYQKYGRTKRRKWRVERLAFAQELAELRKIEDEKRLARGEKPLSEYPDELREWEQSIAEQPPPAPDSISVSISSTSNTGQLSSNENMSISADDSPAPTSISALRSNAGLSPVTDIAGQALYLADPSGKQVINAGASGEAIYLPSSINSPLSHSPYPQLNNPLLLGSELPLPERMCTVSHCHKVLPGFYRYKRCEQHRLQNRYHSKLKRVREKVEKADGPSEGVEVMPIPAGFEEKQKKVESGKDENDERKKLGRKTDGIDSSEGESSPDTKKARTVCSTAECQNLLLPSLRWRTCELCRATQRKRRTEQRLAERWAPQELAPAPHNQSTHHVPGDESQIVQDNAAGVSDEEKNQPDPEGDADVDMDTENAKLADSINNGPRPGALDERRDPVSATPSTGSPISLPGSTATTATKNLITLSNTDTFRAYQPKTTTSAIGRILAKNPHISVDAFSSLLQPSGTRAGIPSETTSGTDSSPANESSTPSIPTPTLPIPTPFVYHPPAKKQRLGTENFLSSKKDIAGTFAPGSTAAALENASYHLRWKPTILQAQGSSVMYSPIKSPPLIIEPSSFVNITPAISEAMATQSVARDESRKEKANTDKGKDKFDYGQSPPARPDLYSSPYRYPPVNYPYTYYIPPYGMPSYGMPPPPPPSGETSSSSPYPPYPYPYGCGPVLPSPAYMYNLGQINRYPTLYGQPGYPPPHLGAYSPPPPGLYPPSLAYPPPPGSYSVPTASYHATLPPSTFASGYPTFSPSASTVPTSTTTVSPPFAASPKSDVIFHSTHGGATTAAAENLRKRNDHAHIIPQALGASTTASLPVSKTTVDVVTNSTSQIPSVAGTTSNLAENVILTNGIQSSNTDSGSLKCADKGCTRIPSTGTICEKCRLKLKKHQAKAKQRFRLEPRKSLIQSLGSTSRSGRSSEASQPTAENV